MNNAAPWKTRLNFQGKPWEYVRSTEQPKDYLERKYGPLIEKDKRAHRRKKS